MTQYLKKPIIRDGVPHQNEGFEGEIRFGMYKGKLRQYVRINNYWHATTLVSAEGGGDWA